MTHKMAFVRSDLSLITLKVNGLNFSNWKILSGSVNKKIIIMQLYVAHEGLTVFSRSHIGSNERDGKRYSMQINIRKEHVYLYLYQTI